MEDKRNRLCDFCNLGTGACGVVANEHQMNFFLAHNICK